MTPTTKREIKLNDKLTEMVSKVNAEVTELQNQIKSKVEQVNQVITGVCLNEGLDLTTEGVYFSDDLTVLHVFDLPKKEEPKETNKPVEEKPKGKVRKMKI